MTMVRFFSTAPLTVLLLALAHDAAAAPSRLFAVVVGSNDPGQTGLARLQYADDDAIRNEEVLALLGAKTRLLASVDGATRDKYPAGAQAARPPTVENLRRALVETFAEIRQARGSGQHTEFYFWYSGHGAVRGDGGTLLLEDGGLFSRQDLYDLVLSDSPAAFNHVLIDACNAADFVSNKGEESLADRKARQKRLLDSYADQQSLERFRNVGVIFAANTEGRVHEWSRYQGGVFSFQLRSALLNGADVYAADLTRDRKVTYLEAFAFLTAANQEVKGDDAHMDVVLRVHEDERQRVLADWSDRSPGSALRVKAGKGRHLRVSDDREVPLLETNKDIPDEAWLVLPPRPGYLLHDLLPGGAERTIELPGSGAAVVYDDLVDGPEANAIGPRGDVPQRLRRGLFRVPFGRSYYLGLTSRHRPRGNAELVIASGASSGGSRLRSWGVGLLAAALVSASGGALFYYTADRAYQDFNRASPADKPRYRQTTERYDGLATVSLIAAGVIGTAGGALLAVDWLLPAPVGERTLGLTAGGRF